MNEDIKNLEENYSGWIIRRPLQLVSGSGVIVKDINGTEYIDCVGGNGVCITGHSHPKIIKAIKDQADKLITCPTIFYNEMRAKLYQKLAQITPKGLKKTFLSNSGAESIECAIKLARKATSKLEIIAMKQGFHGRTLGALSATWNPKYRTPFLPTESNMKHVRYGDIEDLKNAISEKTGAILLEAIQGEAGIVFPPEGYLQQVRDLCNVKDILLIVDEVQTGFGRTGKFFACEHENIQPDIMTMAKGIAGGIPMGATIAKEDVFDQLKPGEHYSTFGGNPLACASSLATINVIESEHLVENSAYLGTKLLDQLKESLSDVKIIKDIRGKGLFIAIELRVKNKEYVLKALERGLLVLTSQKTILRFLPPIIINEDQINKIIEIMKNIFL
ncbi:MAG: aspartate aminotransferase family protein [Candidatus Lokiarchaeota archaeon]|nr:aspartate aminotransferase family protein [Candidatus Lokiarchaeota archaeon]